MSSRTNLALVPKTRTAVETVQARPAQTDKQGALIISQKDIDRIPAGHRPQYMTQLFGKIVTEQISARGWWQRVKGRWQR